jgi:FMN phosphatase YigB (HAD superfamily)
MAMTLEKYAEHLDTLDLVWPVPPPVAPAKARPFLVRMPQVRAVTWSVYGTLLNIFSGQLLFEHPQKFVMDIALDKVVQEFKMWASMTRKPGQPSEYMGELYRRVIEDLKLAPSPKEKYPELISERIWEGIFKKLQQKEYKYDPAFYGTQEEYCRKIAYFFHASLQGTACYEGASQALESAHHAGLKQALLADAQCFTCVQLQRGLTQQRCGVPFDQLFDRNAQALSCEIGGRKPSERLFKHCLKQLQAQGIAPAQVLHVGSRVEFDVVPAKKLGMRTALYAGDKESLQVTKDQLRDNATRPDAMLTELSQIAEMVGT